MTRRGSLNATSTPIRAGSASSSLTPDAAAGGDISDITCTGNITLNAPTNPSNRQILRYAFLASGALRTVTFAGGIVKSTGLTLGPFSIPQNEVLLAALEYSTLRGTDAWILTAATVSG